MDHLLEDRCEVLDDLVSDLWGPVLPDVLGSVGHDSTSHCSASDSTSVSASDVSLVARVGRGGKRLVAGSGILRTGCSRYATRTWPGVWSGATIERRRNRRPNSGCVGPVISISWVDSSSGFLKRALRCVLV